MKIWFFVFVCIISQSASATSEVCQKADTQVKIAILENELTADNARNASNALIELINSDVTKETRLMAKLHTTFLGAYFSKLEIDRALNTGQPIDAVAKQVFCKAIGMK